MIPRLPRSFKAGPFKIKVTLATQPVMRDLADDEEGGIYEGLFQMDGESNPPTGHIYILKDLPRTKQWRVLGHELQHGILDLFDFYCDGMEGGQ